MICMYILLSACSSDIKNIPENILKRAFAEVGLKTIGFADHMWDSIRGASSGMFPGYESYNANKDMIRKIHMV